MLPEFKAKTRVTVNLPAPSGYRQTVPAMNVPEPDPAVGRLGGGRLALWACVAVGLHAALFLAIYLTPPLRLKVGYGPDRWVRIMAIEPVASASPGAAPADGAREPRCGASPPVTGPPSPASLKPRNNAG